MKFKNTILATVALITAIPTSSDAAIIVWGNSTDVSAPTDASINGSLVFAANIGGSTVTINGITFTGSTNAGNPATTGSTDVTNGATDRWGSASFGSYGNSSQTGDYAALLTSGIYTNGDGSTHTHTLSNLTIGQQYEIQFWASDTRSGSRIQNLSDGETPTPSAVSLDSSSIGQYVIGTFTADATNQTLVWRETGSASNGATANAMQLRAIPEPSSTVLFGLSALLLTIRHRR